MRHTIVLMKSKLDWNT